MNDEKTTNELQKENTEELAPKKEWKTPELIAYKLGDFTESGGGGSSDMGGWES